MINASWNPLKIAKYSIPIIKIIVVAEKHEIKLPTGLLVYPFSDKYPMRKAAITNPQRYPAVGPTSTCMPDFICAKTGMPMAPSKI